MRQTAALTGIVGMKPTCGRVSSYGLIAFASSLDQIGPMTRDVADGALLLQAIAGNDPRDSTSSSRPVPDYLATLTDGVKGMRLGVPKEYFVAGMEPAVGQPIRDAVRRLEQPGAAIEGGSPAPPHRGLAPPYRTAPAEARP